MRARATERAPRGHEKRKTSDKGPPLWCIKNWKWVVGLFRLEIRGRERTISTASNDARAAVKLPAANSTPHIRHRADRPAIPIRLEQFGCREVVELALRASHRVRREPFAESRNDLARHANKR